MSAIFGTYNLNGEPADRANLEQMAKTLAYRGRDGNGVWIDGSIGLGHCMMWNTPESLEEHLPSRYKSGHLCITADARLDNRDELISALRLMDRPKQEISDSELILNSYEKWAESCPEKLLGDFAFAIWDTRRQTLFCARDHFGAKHFYYYYRADRLFAVASEQKAILGLPGVLTRINELAIADHFLPIYEDKTITMYQDLFRLPSGHSMTVSRDDGVKIRRYYTADLSKELRLRSDEEYAEAFREIFKEAVRCRLRSAFPVASMLSGGLDSSSIACTARLVMANEGDPRPLHTFSGVFPSFAEISPGSDEGAYQRAVISQGGFVPHDVRADNISPLTDIHKIFFHMENALPAPNMYMDWAIFKAAEQEGVRSLMSGNDGDTTISYGFEDFSEYVIRGRFIDLTKQAVALCNMNARMHGKDWLHTFKKTVWGWGFKTAVRAVMPDYALHLKRRMTGQTHNIGLADLAGSYRTRPFKPDFVTRMKVVERYVKLMQGTYPSNVRARPGHWFAITSGTDAFVLESFEKASAAFSMEMRYPFFDRRVVEFCLALPPGQKLKDGWTRSILRRSMEGILPPSVQWRTSKSDISAGIRLNLLKYERHTLEDVILRDPSAIQDYVDVSALRAAYHRYAADPWSVHTIADNFSILLAVNLALWLREFAASAKAA